MPPPPPPAQDGALKRVILLAIQNDRRISNHEADGIIGVTKLDAQVTDAEYATLCHLVSWSKSLSVTSRNKIMNYLADALALKGPYVKNKVRDLVGQPLVSTHQCVTLLQYYTHVGLTSGWRQGLRVRGNDALIERGTAIATFEYGKYPNKAHGNHGAFYDGQDATGIYVVEQWSGLDAIQRRHVTFQGLDGMMWKDPSNNGDAFSVIRKV